MSENVQDMVEREGEYRSLTQSLSRAHAFRADEAKCSGGGCERRGYCDRFMRPTAPGQQWASFYVLDGECSFFVPALGEAA